MFKQISISFAFFLTFFLVNQSIQMPTLKKQSLRIIFPKETNNLLALGNKEILSSLYWINHIQTFDIKKNDDPHEFHSANNILELSPYFYFNYKYNSLTLAIIKDQFKHSNEISKRGLEIFPKSYDLFFQLGFNLFFLQDKEHEGERYFDEIYEKNLYQESNPLYPLMYSRVKRKSNKELISKKILKEFYQKTDDQKLRRAIKERIN